MIKLKPTYKTMLWGGTKIRDVLHKDTGNLKRIAESWELSTHPNGKSVIIGGEFDGRTLDEYLDSVGWELFGEYAKKWHQLPIMIKYIDARENLSVQVHPTDKYTKRHEADGGKNEMWFILDADETAFIYLGFKRDVTKDEVRLAIENGKIEELLNRIPVKKGEVYYIPAGTVHAIGAGCLLCEVQQTSDATYRLYDYGRLDDDGTPRPCHLKDGLAVLNCKKTALSTRRSGAAKKRAENMLGEIEKLTLSEYNAEGESAYFFPSAKFIVALVLEGKGTIEGYDKVDTVQGDTWILTESSVKISGNCRILIVSY